MMTAKLSKKIGNIRHSSSYFKFNLGFFVHWEHFLFPNLYEFYIAAGLVGMVMGGIQALSRSTFSKMIPETDNPTSYFSFFDVSQKVSIVFGMTLVRIFRSNYRKYEGFYFSFCY